jgi:FSR family fosmidomycin resistance protein-like MFS transporter
MAAGSRRGLAQSIFQVGGNSGQALASVMTALIFAPLGQMGAVWFTFVAAAAILVQLFIAKWYKGYLMAHPRQPKSKNAVPVSIKRKKQVAFTLSVLLLLIFARSWYGAGITAYYPFYIMDQFGFELKHAQMYIFLYGVTAAIGTFFGGPLADKFGRRNIIFFSILGTAPLALLLPYANEFWAYFILLLNGFILMSSTSVTVVYAQELLPGKVGTVSGLTNGFSFGLGALGAVALGGLADLYHMKFVMQLCSFLPLLGLAAILLPSDRKLKEWAATDE